MKTKITVQIYRALDGWRWRAVLGGHVIAESGEGYNSKSWARRMANKIFPNKAKAKVLVYK